MTVRGGWDLSLTVSGTEYKFHLYQKLVTRIFRPPYLHSYSPRDATRTDLPGRPGDRNLAQGVLYWPQTDWIGGEGSAGQNKNFWSTDNPSEYDNGTANGRTAGQFTTPPQKTTTSVAPGAVTVGAGPYFITSGGYGLIAGDENVWSTTDMSTFTAYNLAGKTAGDKITGVAGAVDYFYLFVTDTPTGNGHAQIYECQVGSAIVAVTARAAGVNDSRLALQDQYLYRCQGGRLVQYDISDPTAFPIAPASSPVVDSSGTAIVPPSGSSFDVITTDNSICWFVGQAGKTFVREFKDNVGALLWTFPNGFTGRAICYYENILYMVADYAGSAVLCRFYLPGRYELPKRFIRRGTSYTPASVVAGMGAQLLLGMTSGDVFVYDIEHDAISYLGIAASTLTSVGAYTSTRIAVTRGAQFGVYTWLSDDSTSVMATGNIVSEVWDMDIPEERKTLFGVHVVFKPMTGTETIQVEYQKNESGTWTTIQTEQSSNTIVAATTDTYGGTGASGDVYLTASTPSSTVQGRLFRFRVTVGYGGGGTTAAVVYSITPHFGVLKRDQVFDFYVKLTDITTSNENLQVQQAVANLRTSAAANVLATLTIGNEDPKPGGTTTYTVVLNSVDIAVNRINTRTSRGDDTVDGWAHITATVMTP